METHKPVADDRGDAGGREEVDGVVVVSGGDAPEFLEAAEHALDGVSVAVEHGREAALQVAGWPWAGRWAWCRSPRPDGGWLCCRRPCHPGDAGIRHLLQQDRLRRAIGGFAFGEQEDDGPAGTIGQRGDPGRALAA